ncbi:hypothetical protein BDN71DRAFT_1500366 [Pleurotus eryngii]|uniref:Uncharacterized protein n=1 Tax=Pleurotus eryngii TaxID=5323 RepID=A0A9P6DEQ5_PLEER|nr:hypothetical protein BDN71DRAFT_1500366 [Pleurotus eryngii]
MNHQANPDDKLSTTQTNLALFDGVKGKTPQAWWGLLENYTFGLRFLAGVWEDSASVGLLWVAADREGLKPLSEIRVPLWSWASKKVLSHLRTLPDARLQKNPKPPNLSCSMRTFARSDRGCISDP